MDDGDLFVRHGLVIPAPELRETASRSGGPGGQHVNKANTRVTLRWCRARERSALRGVARRALVRRLGARVTRAGDVVVHAAQQRSRAATATLARERLAELLRDALRSRAPRVATKPSRAARASRRRGEAPTRRRLNKRRRRVQRDDDA